MKALWKTLAQRLSTDTGRTFELAGSQGVGGGCINRSIVVQGRDGRRYFVKLNDAARLAMFEAEAAGLQALAQAHAIRVPQPISVDKVEDEAFLVLEYLALRAGDGHTQERLGQQLASLHRVTQTRFGWERDNTIGSTAQYNAWCDDWVTFYGARRLRPQLQLAAERGGEQLQQRGEKLIEALPAFFTGYRPLASLLHGDLWGGNTAALPSGEPVIFDPAVYFGDRETDIAMTELFGGFSPRFYSAYREAWPLDAGYPIRKTLYHLYHVLNHFNLFGGGYGAQARHMLEQLLNEVR